MKKWLAAIIAGVIIVALVLLLERGAAVRTARVKTGTICAYVEERARTTLPRIYHLTMPLSGRIMPITLTPGTAVKRHEIIARLDDSNLRTRLVEAEAKAEGIRRQIVLNKYNAIEETALKESDAWIKIMGNAVTASWKKAEASKAQNQYARWYQESTQKMKQAISLKEKHHAQMVAAQSLVNYESDLVMYNAMRTWDAVIRMLPVYIRQYLGRKLLNREVLKQKLNEMEAALDQAKRDLQRTVITSPINGIVLERYVQNERVMNAGERLLDLGDLDHLEVTADVLSIYASDIKPGDQVEIFGPVIGKNPLAGKVIRVHPRGFTRISSLGVREQRVPVNIAIDQTARARLRQQHRFLGVGFRLQVKIITGKSENALIIPGTALFRNDYGNWHVFAVINGRAVEKEVKVGLTNDAEAEIVSGLRLGDQVIIAPPADVRDGVAVEEIQECR
ncbi:MAG: efflux RND transporter periplasmic adaptor subunit [Victivallaceae bacterium]|nr:efflux RND transporter periplasmic adaptor subunit [Victivallaceae bacterium]